MTTGASPRQVVVDFGVEPGQAPVVDIGPEVTIGELVQASWELERYAIDARQGQRIAQAARRSALLAPPPPNGAGRRT